MYERLALSRDKESVLRLAKEGNVIAMPEDIIKQPTVLEFLEMEEKAKYSETDLETALINKLQKFLLELGKGYLFEAKKSYTIAVTNLPQLFEKYKHQYVENKYFQLALGFHPELVHQYSNQQLLFKELINETRFIGEIGLDFAKKSKEDVTKQTEVFEKILEWCSGNNKILVFIVGLLQRK